MTRPLLAAVVLLFLAVVVGQWLPGCASAEPAADAVEAEDPALVLVSIDGYRWDYLDRATVDQPTLRFIAEGVRAERLAPEFPTKTFPNHYSLVTGLYPSQHGIVGNTMRDPERLVDGEPARFSLSNREAIVDGRWWGGEPIWATAENQGLTAATVFWPGSEAEIGGVRPTHWLPYDGDLAYADRIDQALEWLDDGSDLVTLYFEAVDTAGHRFGPEADETNEAIEQVDAALARLVDGLRQRGRLEATDLVIVSDHGMAAVSPERVVLLDDAIDLDAVDVDWGEPVGIWPEEGQDPKAIAEAISALPHLTAYPKPDVPERLHYSDNARIPPVVVLADEGWTASSRAYVERNPDRPSGGTHGYDNRVESMHGLFLARGPSFRSGLVTGPIRTVDVYDIVAEALGLDAAPNEGDPEAAARVLR
ncbi:ectonucleotide pyrophosphatase/phosphodiesterase [Rubrivirga marina]|uniref:Alkaline phosphatase family protein n=1 Tax=Rubrivirga marina TaxID=1196024 RepID=A0A271J0B6_9BACT|nr:ectonucleotide pyrophosphatase/phosphodiesterase [Rubrivirga marina]PAP76678.1 hypothetical protein BSZ37_09610 [Rubrivirga marina]